jgi:hypothetical protein
MSEIVSLKMITGEELVTELKSTLTLLGSDKPTSYVVRRPHILQFQQVRPGQLGLAFVPWTLSNPEIETLEIPANSVLVKFTPAENVQQQYLQQTSSIQIAKTL